MKIFTLLSGVVALFSATAAFAQMPTEGDIKVMSSTPTGSVTVMGLVKQMIYDNADRKIGPIVDVLVGRDGRISAFVVSAGGFVGVPKHDVLVSVSAVEVANKNGKDYLILDVTKQELKDVPGFQYDRGAMTWAPEDSRPSTRGNDGSKVRLLSGQ